MEVTDLVTSRVLKTAFETAKMTLLARSFAWRVRVLIAHMYKFIT